MKTDLTVSAYLMHKNKILLVNHIKTGLWLPPGGHIEKNETPDEALRREIKQELGLEIKFLNTPKIPQKGNIIEQLAIPFYCNTLFIIDHIHYCAFYLCEPSTYNIKINHEELRDYELFTRNQLYTNKISDDVRNIGLLAFDKYKEIIR